MFDQLFFYAVVASVIAVAIILLLGIGTFGAGGEFNRKHANRIMRWRIGAQAFAVVMILAYVWYRN